MGALQQLKLVLWKVLLQRWRQPLVLMLEIVWPILIFLVIVLVRREVPPTTESACYYSPRAMPSTGLPFLQSFVCNIGKQCRESKEDAMLMPNEQMEAFSAAIGPLYADASGNSSVLQDLPAVTSTLKEVNKLFKDPEIRNMLNADYRVGDLLRDEQAVYNYLTKPDIGLSLAAAQALLDAKINVSKIFEWSSKVDFKAIVCDVKRLTSYLVLPSSADPVTVSRQLCNLDTVLVANITSALQQQIDIAAVFRMLAQMERVLGKYSYSQQLEDAATMLDLLSNLPSLSISDIQRTLGWFRQGVSILQRLDEEETDVEQWTMLVQDLEPLIQMFDMNASWWLDMKMSLGAMAQVSQLLLDGPQWYTDVSVTLSDILEEDLLLHELFDDEDNVTSSLLHVLTSSPVDLVKLSEYIPQLAAGDVRTVLCHDPGLASLIIPTDTAQQNAASDLQNKLCDPNKNESFNKLADLFTRTDLLREVFAERREQHLESYAQLNWTALARSGDKMFAWMHKFLNDIRLMTGDGLVKTWGRLADSAQIMTEYLSPGNENSLDNIGRALQNIQYLTSLDPAANATMHQVLIFTQVYLNYLDKLDRQIIDAGSLLVEMLEEESEFGAMLRELNAKNPDAAKSLILILLSPSKVQMLMEHSSTLDLLLCNATAVGLVIDMPVSSVNVRDLTSALCSANVTSILTKYIRLRDLTELQNTLMEHVRFVTTDPSQLDDKFLRGVDLANVTKKIQDLLSRPQGTPGTAWYSVMETVQQIFSSSSSATDMFWFDAYKEIETLFTGPASRGLVTSFGGVCEESEIWPSIAPYVHVASLYTAMSASNARIYSEVFGNNGDLNQLLVLLVDNGPHLLSALADTLNDTKKRAELLEAGDLATLVCDMQTFTEVFSMAADEVPLDELQLKLCGMLQSSAQWMSSSEEQEAMTQKIVEILTNPSQAASQPVDWEQMYDNMVDIVEGSSALWSNNDDHKSWLHHLTTADASLYLQALNKLQSVDVPADDMSRLWMMMGGLGEGMMFEQTYYSYIINQNVIILNERMRKMQDGKLTIRDLVSNDSRAEAMIRMILSESPELIPALKDSVITPMQMMTMLIDGGQYTGLCHSMSINDVITLPPQADVAALEKALCSSNYTSTLMQEIHKELFMSNAIMKMIEQFSTYDPELVPEDYDPSQLSADIHALTQTMQVIFTTASLPPPFNVNQIMANLAKLNSTEAMLESLQASLGEVLVMTDLPPEVNSFMYSSLLMYRALTSILHKINGSDVVYITDLVGSDEFTQYINAQQDDDLAAALAYNVIILNSQSEKLSNLLEKGISWSDFCMNVTLLEQLYVQPPSLSVTAQQVHAALCDDAMNITLVLSQIQQTHPHLRDYFALSLGSVNVEDIPEVTLSEYFEAYTQYMQLLAVVVSKPRQVLLSPTWTWKDPAAMMKAMNASFSDFFTELEKLSNRSWDSYVVGRENLMFLNELPSSPVMTQLTAVIEHTISGMRNMAGTNLSLTDLFPDSPETHELISHLRHLPVLYEALTATALSSGSTMSALLSGAPGELCYASNKDQYFVISEEKRAALAEALDDLCNVNFTKVLGELSSLYNTDMVNDSKKDPADTFYELIKMLESLENMSAPVWSQDYSWFHKTNWTAVWSVMMQQQNDPNYIENMMRNAIEAQVSSMASDDDMLRMINYIADIMTYALSRVAGKNVSLEEVFKDSPETQKLTGLLNYLPAMYETLITTAIISPAKLTVAFEPAFACNATVRPYVFEIPPSKREMLNEALDLLCSLNYTIIEQENTMDFPQYANKTFDGNTTAIVEKLLLIQAKLTSLSDTQWVQDYSWFYATNWTIAWNLLQKQYTSPSYDAKYFENLQSLVDSDPLAAKWAQVMLSSIRLAEFFLPGEAELLTGRENIQRLVQLSAMQADVFYIIYTSFMQSAKILPLLEKDPLFFCGEENIDTYITVPSEASVNLTAFQHLFCQINFTALAIEEGELWSELLQPFTSRGSNETTSPVNVTELFWKIASFQMKLGNVPTKTWNDYGLTIDVESWALIIGQLESDRMSQQPDAADLLGLIAALDWLSPPDANQSMWLDLRLWHSILNISTHKLNLLVNRTNVRLRDMFPDSPNVQKLLDLVEEAPDVVPVFTASVGSSKLQQLLQYNGTTAFVLLCTQNISTFLERPETVSTSQLEGIRDRFCLIDWETLTAELYSDLKIFEITSELNSENYVSWTDLYRQYLYYQSAVDALAKGTPSFDPHHPYLNASHWLQALGTYADTAAIPEQSMQMYVSLMSSILVDTDPNTLLVYRVMADVMSAMRTRVEALPAGPLTLSSLLYDAPYLRQYLEHSLELTPDTVEAILHATITKPAALRELIANALQHNNAEFFCNLTTEDYQALFDFPPSVDLDGLYRLQCGTNDSVLIYDFIRTAGIDVILARLDAYGTTGNVTWLHTNWTQYFADSDYLTKRITQLLTNESVSFETPKLDIERINNVLSQIMSQTNYSEAPDILRLYEQTLKSIYPDDAEKVEHLINRYYDVAAVLMEYFNDLATLSYKQVKSDGNIHLFAESMQLQEWLNKTQDINADLIKKLTQIEITPEQLYLLISAGDDLNLCDPQHLTLYLTLPEGFDLEALSDAFCRTNMSLIISDISKQFSTDMLIKKISEAWENPRSVNVSELMTVYNKLIQNLMLLANVSGVNAYSTALAKMASQFNMTSLQALELPRIWKALQGHVDADVSPELIQIYASSVEQLERALVGTSYENLWREQVVRNAVAAQVFMRIARTRLEGNITLGDILEGTPLTEEYISSAALLSPETVAALLSSRVNISKLLLMEDERNVSSALCGEAVIFPGDIDQEALRGLCFSVLNHSAFSAEIEKYLSIEHVSRQILNMDLLNLTEAFNWTTYFTEVFAFNSDLTEYFAHAEFPSLTEFLLYDGNWTAWLAALDEAMMQPAFNEFNAQTIQWLAGMLESLQLDDEALKPVVNYMLSVQKLTHILRQPITEIKANMTLEDLLKNDSAITTLLKQVSSSANITVLQNQVDLQAVLELVRSGENADLHQLLCQTEAVSYMNADIEKMAKQILCNSSHEEVLTKLADVVDWKAVIDEIGSINSTMGMERLNWTSFLMDLYWLQHYVSSGIEGAITVSDLLRLMADDMLSAWMVAFENLDIYQILDDTLRQLSLTLAGYDDPAVGQVDHAMSALVRSIHSLLQSRLSDSRLSLSDLIVNSTEAQRMLAALSSEGNARFIRAFLGAQMDPSLLADLLTSPNLTVSAFCAGDIGDLLDVDDDIELSELQEQICRLNTTDLIKQLQAYTNISQLITQFSRISQIDIPAWNASRQSTLEGDIDKLISLIRSLNINSSTVLSDLQAVFNISGYKSLLDDLLLADLQTHLNATIRNFAWRTWERYMGNSTLPQLHSMSKMAETWTTTLTNFTWSNDILRNPGRITDLVKKLFQPSLLLPVFLEDEATRKMIEPYITDALKSLPSSSMYTNVEEILQESSNQLLAGLSRSLAGTNHSALVHLLNMTHLTAQLTQPNQLNTTSLINSILEVSRALDATLGQNEAWITFKQSLHASYLVNDLLTGDASGKNGSVAFHEVLEKMDRLQSAVSSQALYQLMSATYDEQTLMMLVDQQALVNLVCNSSLFRMSVHLQHEEYNVLVQRELCEAAQSESFTLTELHTLLRLRQTVHNMLNAEPQAIPENIFELWLDMCMKLYAEADYLSKMPELLSGMFGLNLTQNNLWGADSYCRDVTATMYALPSVDFEKSFGNAYIWLEWTSNAMRALPDLENLMCSLAHDNLTEVYMKLRNTSIITLIQEFPTTRYNQVSVSCSEYIAKQMTFQKDLELYLPMTGSILNSSLTCIADTAGKPVPALTELQGFVNILADFNELISMVRLDMPDLDLSLIKPYLDLLYMAIVQPKPEWVGLNDILKNATSTLEMISRLTELSPQTIDALLGASFDLNMVTAYGSTNIQTAICEPGLLDQILELPVDSAINTSDVSRFFCNENVTQIVDTLRSSVDASKLFLQLVTRTPHHVTNVTWLEDIFDTLIRDLESLVDIARYYDDIDSMQILQVIPKIQQLFVDQVPDRVFNSFHELTEVLKSVAKDETSQGILNDIQTVADGIKGLNALKKLFPQNVHLKSLLKSPEDFKKFMVDDLRLNPDVAQALLDSSISYKQLLNFSVDDVTRQVCEPDSLSEILIFNVTVLERDGISVTNISHELCNLDNQRASDVIQYLVTNFDVGTLVFSVLEWNPQSILDRTNVTKEDLQKVTKNLEPLGSSLNEVFKSISNISAGFDPMKLRQILSQPQEDRCKDKFSVICVAGSEALSSFSQVLCGRDNAFDVEDSYGIQDDLDTDESRRKKRETNEQSNKEIPSYDKNELDNFKTQFCQDLYLDIVETRSGRIAWNYLKPLMVGKIPYAPNTAETAAIMKEAMRIFDGLNGLKTLTGYLVDGADNLKQLADNSTLDISLLQDSLSNPLVSAAISELVGIDSSILVDQLKMLSGVSEDDTDFMVFFAQLASNLSDCVLLDRLEAFENEEELVKRSLELSKTNNILAGVVFMMDEDARYERSVESTMLHLPQHITYKIRMDIEQVPLTSRIRSEYYSSGPTDDMAADMRYLRGFIQLQDLIDTAIITLQATQNVTLPSVLIQEEPYPCHNQDDFKMLVNRFVVPVIMVLAWLVAVANSVRILVYERQIGIDKTMAVMGLRSGVRWMAWFLNTFVTMLLMSIIIVLFLKLGNITPYTDPILLFVFFACFSLSTTMLCYFLSTFFGRATSAALSSTLIYLISYLPYILIASMGDKLLRWHINLLSLSAPTSFCYGMWVISDTEVRSLGSTWSNLFTHSTRNNGFSLAWAGGMMLIDAAIYAVLGWYLSNLLHGHYGVKQPWYFPLSPTYWGCKRPKAKSSSKYKFTDYGNPKYDDEKHGGKGHGSTTEAIRSAQGPGEADPDNLPIGISTHHLRKKYKGSKAPALDDVTFNVYQNQVTALLGHNGAGKTTAIHLLTGMHKVTSGNAFIAGRSVLSGTSSVNKQLGFCPQQDTLFENMTVKEHLEFYVSLKDPGSRENQRQQVSEMLEDLGLEKSKNVKVGQLSGGQCRRLSVAIAFIGGSSIIILDEPTSGVDSRARRRIWELVARHRQGRTVLLSTHYMDEADVLADRILVLHQGKLVVTGSPLFLKQEYGSGYELVLDKGTETKGDPESFSRNKRILDFVTSSLHGSRIVSQMGTELKFVLPNDKRQQFAGFFQALEKSKDDLRILSYGVSDTTLEEVVLKLITWCELGRPLKDSQSIRQWDLDNRHGEDSDVSSVDSGMELSSAVSDSQGPGVSETQDEKTFVKKKKGTSLKFAQFWALLVKRFHHNRRDVKNYFSQIILPCVFVCLAMVFTKIKPSPEDMPSLLLSPQLYVPEVDKSLLDRIVFVRRHGSGVLSDSFINTLFSPPGLGTTCMQDSQTQFECSGTAGPWKNFSYFPGPYPDCECTSRGQECSSRAAGPKPPSWPTGNGISIYNISDSPFDTTDYLLRIHQNGAVSDFKALNLGGTEFNQYDNEAEVEATVWYNSKQWHSLPAMYNTLSNMALRANVNPQESSSYGITTYNHPLPSTKEQLSQDSLMTGIADTGIALVVLFAFCFVPAGFAIYVISERVDLEKRLQYTCGVGSGLYWFTSIIWDMISFTVTVGLAVAIAAAFQLSFFTANLNLIALALLLWLFCWATVPMMYALSWFFKEPSTGYMVLFLLNFFIGLTTTACVFLMSIFKDDNKNLADAYELLQYIFMVFPQFCLGNGLVKLTENQLKADIYAMFNIDVYKNPFSFTMVGWHLVAMALFSVFFFFLLVVLECQCSCRRKRMKAVKADYKEDSDVGLERQRIMVGDCKDDLLVMQGLRKKFRRGLKEIVAVDNLSIGIPPSECFGLLGVNGAGKTTTFKMITGEHEPTRGDALFKGKIISTYQPDMQQDVGYCPQFTALDKLLSVDENLILYARLKGIPAKECDVAVKALDLEQYRHRVVGKLSIGTQRKLSAAIALLGTPSLILMDEPTTGMDVKTKRLVWNAITRVIKDKRAVLFTSHSLAECEALCTRLAIMVNGKAVCLGSTTHVKNKYGKGYTVIARVLDAHVDQAISFMLESFPGTKIKDQHLNVVTMEIPITMGTVAELFFKLESHKERLSILDYSVSQTSLDQIFINFAKAQHDGSDIDPESSFEGRNTFPASPSGPPYSDAVVLGSTSSSLRQHKPPNISQPSSQVAYLSEVRVDPQGPQTVQVAEPSPQPFVNEVFVGGNSSESASRSQGPPAKQDDMTHM